MKIRQENANDFIAVFNLIKKAFEKETLSDHKEHFLVERLRTSDTFIPELSLVAEINNKIVGHILLTKLNIINKTNKIESLALAPLSVLPDFQRKGIGGGLINTSHKIAKNLGYRSIILLGHETYYPRFGYKPLDTFNITLPFPAPKENCMALELIPNGLNGVNGVVEYPKAFFE